MAMPITRAAAVSRVRRLWRRRLRRARTTSRRKATATVAEGADGLVRITLKKAYTDGTVAVDMDPRSLLCRLATSVPPPRFHTVRYAGVLAAASPWRPEIAPMPPTEEPAAASAEPDRTRPAGGYRPWAELLARAAATGTSATRPPSL